MLARVRQCVPRAAWRPRSFVPLAHGTTLRRGFASSELKWGVMNEDITARVVNLVDHDGKMRVNVPLEQAMDEAARQGVDLVQVSPFRKLPAVCKLFDAKKRRYEMKKATKRHAKQQKPKPDKEVVIGAKIAPNDLKIKVEHLKRFLTKGHKVKVTVKCLYDEANASKRQALDQLQHIEDSVNPTLGVVSGLPMDQHGAVYVFYLPASAVNVA
ncbi:hypothetical protein PsorP6_017991 [Peronosclerospora sorghi]|uniref:Uncharacterized protein n=1 Tax=Peronosclerospora sorghi TaxID=230839 RepID=A0ACC0WG17_9STRA|nr:hypothetical protein PsorP6_017991 [Peronosclerospora sorghi]